MEKYIKSESGIYYMNLKNGCVSVTSSTIYRFYTVSAQETLDGKFNPCTREEFEEAFNNAIEDLKHQTSLSLTDDEFESLRDSLNWEYETETDEGQKGDGYMTESIPSLVTVIGVKVDGVDYTDRLTASQWERAQEMYDFQFWE